MAEAYCTWFGHKGGKADVIANFKTYTFFPLKTRVSADCHQVVGRGSKICISNVDARCPLTANYTFSVY